MPGNQISDSGISAYHSNADTNFSTVINVLALLKDCPVTVKIHSCKVPLVFLGDNS